jgi:hypothetical protein
MCLSFMSVLSSTVGAVYDRPYVLASTSRAVRDRPYSSRGIFDVSPHAEDSLRVFMRDFLAVGIAN